MLAAIVGEPIIKDHATRPPVMNRPNRLRSPWHNLVRIHRLFVRCKLVPAQDSSRRLPARDDATEVQVDAANSRERLIGDEIGV
jgi:hypothetical protein